MEEETSDVRPEMTFIDPFVHLKGMPVVLEKILDYLDYKSLGNVHQVSKLWNEMVKNGFSWRKQLQKKILSEIVWEEVKNQLPEDINESADCPDKEKYATLFKAVKKLDQNWKTGCFNKRIIRLDDGDSFNEQECANITDLFTMDSKSVAVGCRSGLIKIFNRKDFSLQKILNHGKDAEFKLLYVKFEGDYLISASPFFVKIWDKETKLLLDTLELVHPKLEGPLKCLRFGSGHGYLVLWDSWGKIMFTDGIQELNHKLFFWRLTKRRKMKKHNSLFELINREQLLISPFLLNQLRVSENYVVAALIRFLPDQADMREVWIEVRSTVDFSVIYSVKQQALAALCCKFVDDIFGIHIASASGREFIRFINCVQKSFRDIESENGFVVRSNSRFALLLLPSLRLDIIDVRPLLSFSKTSKPKQVEIFQFFPRSPIEETELKITDHSISFGDFGSMIMDELSILHYQQDFNETTGETSFKLVLLDFLELPGTSLFSCCFKCEKPGHGLKLCSRCRRVRYCSVECQRSGWILHKLTCSTPSSN